MAGKEGKKQRKWGRSNRKPGSVLKSKRIYENKLKRVNRDRKKAGKPPLTALPVDSYTSTCYLGGKKR